jgi:membrane protein implicated in regulation of membrane protease activity
MEDLTFWHWLVLGLVLVILEVFAPGAIFLWLGVAAGVVGAILWVIPSISWEWQFILFSIISVLSIVIWRNYLKEHPTDTDQPRLNRRGEQYVGRTFTLEEDIINGIGKIRVDDTTWKISGEDCALGARVKVTGVDGVLLKVECLGD